MADINLRNYAHLGDAVWELFVREITIDVECKMGELHNLTTEKVKAEFQSEMLNFIEDELTADEQDIKRRARNMQVPIARRANQTKYRQATAFEALIGFWHKNDKERLNYFLEKLREKI